MLRKARKVIPRKSCITFYDSMVLPLFDYCSAVWGGCGQTSREYLDRLQRRAVSIIEGRKVEQKWPSLSARQPSESVLFFAGLPLLQHASQRLNTHAPCQNI